MGKTLSLFGTREQGECSELKQEGNFESLCLSKWRTSVAAVFSSMRAAMQSGFGGCTGTVVTDI